MPLGLYLGGFAGFDPGVHLGREGLPETAHFVGGHFLPGQPFVDGARIDAQVRREGCGVRREEPAMGLAGRRVCMAVPRT